MEELSTINHKKSVVQVNHSLTRKIGAIRGMHFQRPPRSEIKMVTCIRGKVFDVAIDLRHGSSTFLCWQGIELSAQNHQMMYIPEGFAHGFQTLSEDCELLYFHTEFYSPDFEDGIRYDDEAVGVKWPLQVTSVSQRDMDHLKIVGREFEGINS
jgi:dTDP-4-dehydrorhamnose 3,5-epimerase